MNQPARVLWLIKGLGPGGAERLLVSLARAHDRRRVELAAAYVLPWKEALVPELEAAGVRVSCLGGERGAADPRWIARLHRLLREEHFDIVHSHSPLVASVARAVVRTMPKRSRPALVTTEHNAWSTFAVPTRVINALTAPADDLSLAVSEQARSSMWWPRLRGRTEVVVHGVDVDAIRAAAASRTAVRGELGAGDGDVVAVTVANYRRQKAWPVLLAAARRALDAAPALRFAGVGQGPLAAEVEAEHARLGLGDRFVLLGARDDVPRILAAGDLFVLASSYEGYPVAVMEALAAGLPVVATGVPGIADAVRDGVEGVLVPAGDATALAEAVVCLVDDPARRASFAAAAGRRGQEFGVDRVARLLEDRYAAFVR